MEAGWEEAGWEEVEGKRGMVDDGLTRLLAPYDTEYKLHLIDPSPPPPKLRPGGGRGLDWA
jgi:hypothetical protein